MSASHRDTGVERLDIRRAPVEGRYRDAASLVSSSVPNRRVHFSEYVLAGGVLAAIASVPQVVDLSVSRDVALLRLLPSWQDGFLDVRKATMEFGSIIVPKLLVKSAESFCRTRCRFVSGPMRAYIFNPERETSHAY